MMNRFMITTDNGTMISACYMKNLSILAITIADDNGISILSMSNDQVIDFLYDLNGLTKSCDIVENLVTDQMTIQYQSRENSFDIHTNDGNTFHVSFTYMCLFDDWLNTVV